jgi:hypothetical protein
MVYQILFMVLISLITTLYLIYFIKNLRLKNLSIYKIVVSCIYLAVSIMTIISLLYSSDYVQFGFTSTSILLYCVISGFILSIVFTSANQIKIVLLSFSAIFYWFLVLKLTFNRPI